MIRQPIIEFCTVNKNLKHPVVAILFSNGKISQINTAPTNNLKDAHDETIWHPHAGNQFYCERNHKLKGYLINNDELDNK